MIRAVIRWLFGKGAETALERHRRQHARANRANAAFVAQELELRETHRRARLDRYDRHGIGDLPRPVYPARQTVWLDGTASKECQSFGVITNCAWSLSHCAEPPADHLGYCVGHMRRILGASTPEVTR